MLKAIVAVPVPSVFTPPVAGQRSSVVRYWTVDHTSTLAAGWPSRRRRTTTLSVEPCGGVGFETFTVVPRNLAARPGCVVAGGTAVAGPGGYAGWDGRRGAVVWPGRETRRR